MQNKIRFMAFLGMILLAIAPGFCQRSTIPSPSVSSPSRGSLVNQQQLLDRLKIQLGASDARFAELQSKILKVMDSDTDFVSPLGEHTGPRVGSPWVIGTGSITPEPFILMLSNYLQDPQTINEQVIRLCHAYETVLARSEAELIAAQHDLDSYATLRERGWLLVDGLIAGAPVRGPGEFGPPYRSNAFDLFLEELQANLGCNEIKWDLIRSMITKVIDNQYDFIGGLPALFPERYRRPSTGPSVLTSTRPSPFQKAVSDLQMTTANPKSTEADIASKIDAALKVKAECDAAYAAAQKDLRAAGLSPRQEAVLVVYGLLSVHHR